MNASPVVHSANLVLPAVVDVCYSVAINVRPVHAVVDHGIIPDVDLANIDRPVVSKSDIWKPRGIVAAGTIWKPVAGTVTRLRPISEPRQCAQPWSFTGSGPVTVTWSDNSWQCLRTHRPIHPEEIPDISG